MMKFLPPAFASNALVLRKLEAEHATLGARATDLKDAYREYARHKGSPAKVAPIGLTKPEARDLYAVYSGEAIKYGVRWIGEYRRAKNYSHCPLCGSANPSQLEHYLPHAHYPEFTVFSWNLVPTCSLCNPKRGHRAHEPGHPDPLVHPYLEPELAFRPFLSARIRPPYVAVTFKPTIVGPFAPETMRRLEWQLAQCLNTDRFDSWLVYRWRTFHLQSANEFATDTALVAHLQKAHDSTAKVGGPNAWDTVFYRALLSDASAQTWLRTTPP